VRDNPRTDDPQPREALRAEERSQLRIRDDGRSRQMTGDAAINPFDITDIYSIYAPTGGDPKNAHNEIDFNWKRWEVHGEQNFSEWLTNQRQGWRAVQHSDFPGRFAPPGTEGPVRVKDMILMERPMRLTVQARQEEYDKASRTLQMHRQVMKTTPEGQAPRLVLADRSAREAIEIPE